MKLPIPASLGKTDKARNNPPKKDVQSDKCPAVMDFCWIFLAAEHYCQELFEHEKRHCQAPEHNSSAAGDGQGWNAELKQPAHRHAELLMHSSIDNFQDFCLCEFPLCSVASSRANSLVYIYLFIIYFFKKLNVEGKLKAISSHTEIVGGWRADWWADGSKRRQNGNHSRMAGGSGRVTCLVLKK